MSYPAGASLQLMPTHRWRKLAACAQFIIQNSCATRPPLAQACSLCHTLRYTLWQTFRVCQSFLYIAGASLQLVTTPCATPFGKLSEFAKVFYTPNSKFPPAGASLQLVPNSKFIIHNSPNSHCKIFAKVGKIPPPRC